MIGRILCRLGFCDWWPIEQPRSTGFSSEALCECRRCKAQRNNLMMFTDQLFDRWAKRAK